jgi:hypothetical protein
MKEIAQALREAYKLIQEADTSDIGTYYLAVEEAQGFIAEALDMAETPKPNSVTLSNIDAMSDELYDALNNAFIEELKAQGKDPEVGWDHWTITAEFTPYEEEV